MTLEQMRFLLTVARHGSVTQAAAELNISQPALSRHITLVEAELNMQLFIRERNRIRLTGAAQVLVQGMERLLAQYDDLIARAQAANSGYAGVVNIGILEDQRLMEVFQRALEHTYKHAPQVQINLSRSSFKGLHQGIRDRRLDLMVLPDFEVRGVADFDFLELEPQRLCFVVPAWHPACAHDSIPLSRVAEFFREDAFILISPSDSDESALRVLADLNSVGFTPKVKYAPGSSVLSLWTEAGMGVAVVNERHPLQGNPALKFIVGDGLPTVTQTLAWNRDLRNPAALRFIDLIRDLKTS